MRTMVAVTTMLAALSGCFGPGGGAADDATPPAGHPDAATAIGQPGLYRLSPERGLEPLDAVPGLVATQGDGVTSYSLDVPELLRDNAEVQFIVQALEPQTMDIAYDIDIPFEPALPLADPNQGSDLVCIGTHIRHDLDEHGFYLERAAGRAGDPPTVGEHGAMRGHAVGHGRAGTVDFLVELYGSRFTLQDQESFPLQAGESVRFGNGISQYPAQATQGDDRHWWQTFTMRGAHRIVLIPDVELYCSLGFGEFEGVQQTGVPPAQYTVGGQRTIDGVYGANVAINLFKPTGERGPDDNPANSAIVEFHGQTCRAGGGQRVVATTFEPGEVTVRVEQWVGTPIVILSGLAMNQGVFSAFDEPTCQP